MQTSLITISALQLVEYQKVQISERDLEWSFCRSGGNGGQNVNKRSTACQLKHKPSGILVRCENERSQPQNKATALSILKAKLQALEDHKVNENTSKCRLQQTGLGVRGKKDRMIRVKDDIVVDYRSNKSISYTKYCRGQFENLV